MSELNFTRAEYELAATTKDEEVMLVLASHPSKYIKARLAGNVATTRAVRDTLRTNQNCTRGIIIWLLGNQDCSREEYMLIFSKYLVQSYCGIVHPALAINQHATIFELQQLLRHNEWGVMMAVLNNHHYSNPAEYLKLIVTYLPSEDSDWEKWNEVEKLAYFRTYGVRRPARS